MKKTIAAFAMVATLPMASFATHIDDGLGINITLYSSDGMGNFVVKYDEYFGSDGNSAPGGAYSHGGMWGGLHSGAALYETVSMTSSLVSGPGVLSQVVPGDFNINFAGIVDAMANPTPGFGVGQASTVSVNGPTDAGLFSGLVAFTISGFDASQSYLVSLASTDCCYVHTGGGPHFDGTLTFDPTVVVDVTPEPTSLVLMGLGCLGLVFFYRRKKVTA